MLRPALIYVAAVFAAGVMLGTVRSLMVEPALGSLLAVLLELPLMLAISWLVAGAILRHWRFNLRQRLGMGAVAFLILLLVEGAVSTAVGTDWLRGLATPAGLVGLAGQVGFALIPALRR